MRLLWLTDLHLNFCTTQQIETLIDELDAAAPGGLLVGGDTGEADSFAGYLSWIAAELGVPVWFVLGNHDYYRGSIKGTRQKAAHVTAQENLVHWLPALGAVALSESAFLIGHGGWGDARSGKFKRSTVFLNDYLLIDELRRAVEQDGGFNGEDCSLLHALESKLLALGDESADFFRRSLPALLANEKPIKLFVLMHVPPFRESCWHEGNVSDDNWAPHFVCQAAGEALQELMAEFPRHQMTVLCGHTHSSGEVDVLPNLKVITSGAVYGAPAVSQVIDV